MCHITIKLPWLNRTIHTTFISLKTDPCLPFSHYHVVLYLGDLTMVPFPYMYLVSSLYVLLTIVAITSFPGNSMESRTSSTGNYQKDTSENFISVFLKDTSGILYKSYRIFNTKIPVFQ